MRETHKDIGQLLRKGGSRRRELEEVEEAGTLKEVAELEKEERLTRWKVKKRTWESRKLCKSVLMEMLEEMLEST